MKRNLSILAVLLVVVLGVTPAFAKGFYVGAGIGNTFYSSTLDADEILDQAQDIDENSTAWKIFGGFNAGQFLGIEGGYRDFGTIESTVEDSPYKHGIKGWDFELLGRIQIAIVDIFAKAGVMFWDSDASWETETLSDSGTDFLWGLGAGVHLGPIGVRLEYEALAVSGSDNISAVSLGATFGF